MVRASDGVSCRLAFLAGDGSPVTEEHARPARSASLVLGGGVGLGAFQVGAFEALQAAGIDFRSISGASIGAINGAIIAGNAPEDRVAKLKAFWASISVEAFPVSWLDPFDLGGRGTSRRMRNWANSAATALGGSPNLFRPRLISGGRGEARSFYDNAVAAKTLPAFLDFDRLNSGEVRFCVAAVDVDAGEAVFFDTAKGERIEVDHILASSSLIPAFEPVRIAGRSLVDGGLACNVPLETEIGPERTGVPEPLCFVVDLFTAGGGQPVPLNRVTESSIDLFFGMQTKMRLVGLLREWELRSELRKAKDAPGTNRSEQGGVDLFYMSYHGAEEDAGFAKPFDLSPATLAERMEEGGRVANRALLMNIDLAIEPHSELKVHLVRAARET